MIAGAAAVPVTRPRVIVLPESSDSLLVKVVVFVSLLEVLEHRSFSHSHDVGCWLRLNALPNIRNCSFEDLIRLRVGLAIRILFGDLEGFRDGHLISGHGWT